MFCGKSFSDKTLDGLKGIFTRKPSALHPLDGIRALAILWVFLTHSFSFCNKPTADSLMACYPIYSTFSYWVEKIALSGDMGVDLFFVISGFLIAFILLKEHKRSGTIDIFGFLTSRFLRLFPVLLFWAIACFIWQISDPKIKDKT